jgi:hypothetical protein
MNLYAVTAVYGTDRDAILFLATDDTAALKLAGRGRDPRGLGSDKTEVWLIAADVIQVGELPAAPAQARSVRTARPLSEIGSMSKLLKDATGP